MARPAQQAASAKGTGLVDAYASSFFLTLTSPMTILSFAAILAGIGVASINGNYPTGGMLVLGVYLGSALWWLFLSGSVSVFRERFNSHGLSWLNRLSGGIIFGFGLLSLARLI